MKSRHHFCTQTAIAALLVGMTGAAFAQASDSIETVTVTGFRASLANALNAKQNSNLVMESIAAEDIGKMPDQDVAESLQRLPGVQINRDQGKGSTVLINGLRQNLITLNGDVFLTGKEFYTYGEASGGGNGGNIQYSSLSTIPSEEIGGIDVYKSPNAGLSEGGLGGIINLKTRDPLSAADGLSVAANLRGSSTSYQSLSKMTPNATVVASYKPISTFAVTAGVSYDDSTTRTREVEAYNRNPWNLTNNAVKGYTGVGPLNATNGETTIGTKYLLPEYMYFSDVYDQSKTTGATAGVTWAPTNAVTTGLTWFFTHNWDRTTNYSNKVGFNGAGSKSSVPGDGSPGINADVPYTIDGNGVVQSATFYLQGAETATLLTVQNSDANNLQWHTRIDDGGPLTGTFDLSYSRATSNLSAAQQDIEHGYYTGPGLNGASIQPTAPGCNNFGTGCTVGNPAIQMQYTNGGSSGLPTVKYIGAYADVLSNPAYALFKSAWGWDNSSKQEEAAIRGAVEYKPKFLNGVDGSFSAGFRAATRDVWENFGRYLIDGVDANGNIIAGSSWGPGMGSGIYYQDPGLGVPYSTATSNPALAKTVNNFAFGNMIVKDPVSGGLNNPSTFLNNVWNTASFVPNNTPSAVYVGGVAVACSGASQPAACSVKSPDKVPNNSEAFYKDTLSSFNVHESTQAFYLMSDLGNKDKGFHINAGVRVVFTHLVVNGATSAPNPVSYGTATWNGVNSNNVPFTSSHSTVDILPSLNAAFYPTDDQIIRFSAARVTSPADLFNLGLGKSYGFTRGAGCAKGSTVTTGTPGVTPGCNMGFEFTGGNAGNPQLDPYRATQFNLAWEDYFAPQALASVGVFYKQVESFEVSQPVATTVMDDFGGTSANVTTPINGGHGKIYGAEFSGQYVFDIGLGIAANYTYTQSESALTTSFSNHLAIPDVAAHAASATVFYENYGFDARMSYSWRSSTLNGTINGPTFGVLDTFTGNTTTYGVYTAAIGQMDAQVRYNFTDYLSAYVGAQNLTNEASHMYLQYKSQPFVYDNTGTRYFFGVSAKY